MSAPSTVPVETRSVGEGPDLITYDVRGDLSAATAERPVLMTVASPMDASGFGTLASHFTDRPVVTYDPRGTGRNPVGTGAITVDRHAADLHAVITALDAGAVDLFASSGGAVNALRLAEQHPDDLRTLVAHEPPTVELLPDRDAALAVVADMLAAYAREGLGPAMARFIALVMHDGVVDAAYLDRPTPDPAMFGLPTEDDGSRTDPLMRNMRDCLRYRPDAAALEQLGDRLVVAVGATSGQTLAARAGRSVAEVLGRPVTVLPGDHGGFLGGEFGQTGEPDAFAAALRVLLER